MKNNPIKTDYMYIPDHAFWRWNKLYGYATYWRRKLRKELQRRKNIRYKFAEVPVVTNDDWIDNITMEMLSGVNPELLGPAPICCDCWTTEERKRCKIQPHQENGMLK